jgi:AraC-like DNA-binding protein
MTPKASTAPVNRVAERRRAVALTHHYREAEGLSIAHIAARLACSPAAVKAYFYDPTGEKAKAVKARYHGVAAVVAPTRSRANGKSAAYAYCEACHPGAIERRWTRERGVAAMREWRARHGRLPSSYDWSRTHARRRGGEAFERLSEGQWPPASVVTAVCGSWPAARTAALASETIV